MWEFELRIGCSPNCSKRLFQLSPLECLHQLVARRPLTNFCLVCLIYPRYTQWTTIWRYYNHFYYMLLLVVVTTRTRLDPHAHKPFIRSHPRRFEAIRSDSKRFEAVQTCVHKHGNMVHVWIEQTSKTNLSRRQQPSSIDDQPDACMLCHNLCACVSAAPITHVNYLLHLF